MSRKKKTTSAPYWLPALSVEQLKPLVPYQIHPRSPNPLNVYEDPFLVTTITGSLYCYENFVLMVPVINIYDLRLEAYTKRQHELLVNGLMVQNPEMVRFGIESDIRKFAESIESNKTNYAAYIIGGSTANECFGYLHAVKDLQLFLEVDKDDESCPSQQ